MLNRLTVSALLKTVIAGHLASAWWSGFSLNAWDSWGRLQTANRISVIADASADHVQGDAQSAHRSLHHRPAAECRRADGCSDIEKYLRGLCATPKCRHGQRARAAPDRWNSPQQQTLVPEFDRLFKTADRRAEGILGRRRQAEGARAAPRCRRNIMETTQGAARRSRQIVGRAGRHRQPSGRRHRPVAGDQADRLAAAQHRAAKYPDSFRSGLAAGHDHAGNAHDNYTKFVGGTDAAWNALELAIAGMQLPPALATAMAATKTAYFEPSYLGLARSPADGAGRGRKGRNDRQPMEPGHGRTPRRRRRRRRSRARRGQASTPRC